MYELVDLLVDLTVGFKVLLFDGELEGKEVVFGVGFMGVEEGELVTFVGADVLIGTEVDLGVGFKEGIFNC